MHYKAQWRLGVSLAEHSLLLFASAVGSEAGGVTLALTTALALDLLTGCGTLLRAV